MVGSLLSFAAGVLTGGIAMLGIVAWLGDAALRDDDADGR